MSFKYVLLSAMGVLLVQAARAEEITKAIDAEAPFAYPVSLLRLVSVVGALIVMLGGSYLVFCQLKQKNQGFGPNSLKALGLVLFLPTLLIVGVAVPSFEGQTLAALLGTVAGYVLSHSKNDDT